VEEKLKTPKLNAFNHFISLTLIVRIRNAGVQIFANKNLGFTAVSVTHECDVVAVQVQCGMPGVRA
jgi:hypothetical protein